MGATFKTEGRIDISPPLPARVIPPNSPYLAENHPAGGDAPVDLVYDIAEDPAGGERAARGLVAACDYPSRFGDLAGQLQALIDAHPRHSFTGTVVFTGEDPSDVNTVTVVGGVAVFAGDPDFPGDLDNVAARQTEPSPHAGRAAAAADPWAHLVTRYSVHRRPPGSPAYRPEDTVHVVRRDELRAVENGGFYTIESQHTWLIVHGGRDDRLWDAALDDWDAFDDDDLGRLALDRDDAITTAHRILGIEERLACP